MPECVLCNSQNFDVMDGLYFCTECGTQSQDVREEVNEITGPIDGKLTVKKTKKRKKRKEYDCGKPWFTLEAFQILIKAQIEFLIKIGVDPAVKDVIAQMWFTFVEQSSNAFGTRQDENFSKITKTRDDIKDFTPTDSIHRKTPKTLSRTKYADDGLELSSEIAREDFYEDDDPTGGLFEDEEENADFESHIGSVDQTYCKSYDDIKVMTMQHTLAFCFLGLLWLQEPVCLSDLIRWAIKGQLPYYNATAYFPSHMKLSQSDITTFTRSTLPVKYHIKTLAERLSKYLNLPEIPRHQINIYITKYAVDLQLTASIYRHICSVVEMFGIDLQSLKAVLNYDDLSMAYIIISLKLIYGLDDVTEHELSKLATNIKQDENLSFPIWEDVIERIYSNQCIHVHYGVPWNKEDLAMLKDCRNYSKFCDGSLFGSWKPDATVHRYKRYVKGMKGLNAEKQQEYGSMFGLLLKTNKDDQVDEKGVTQSTDAELKTTNQFLKQRLSLEVISNYYKSNETTPKLTSDKGSRNQIDKNRYIRYGFRMQRTRELPKLWNDRILPNSLRQLVELCAKVIFCEPAILFNVTQMLEKIIFKEHKD